MAYTNFLGDGVAVNGAPLLPGGGTVPLAQNYFFVCSVNGSNGNTGRDISSPLATIDYAIGLCTANKGDTIIVLQGHAETLTAAGGITCDVAGVNIIGLGTGADRPEISFGTATSASVLVTAANVLIANIVGITAFDALTNPFHIQAAGCTLGCDQYGWVEWQDPSSSLQAVRAVLTTTAADNFNVALKVTGITSGGTAPVNAIRLVGCADGTIQTNFYGRASTGYVEFLTTACSNIEVYGYMYNSGTTDGSKNVVDTATGSTWFANIDDGSAGSSYSGGSGAALASDDVSAVNAKIGTITNSGGTATIGAIFGDFANTTLVSKLDVPSADATSNVDVADVVGNKTDASIYVPGTTKSVAAYAKGTADLQERVAKKTAAIISNGLTLFTIAGGPIKIEALFSICETANDGTASTLQYSVTPTSGAAQTISAASASLASAAEGASVTLAGTALSTAALLNANGPNLIANPGTVMAPAGTITAVVAVGSTTGTWAHYIRYKPLAVGVTVS